MAINHTSRFHLGTAMHRHLYRRIDDASQHTLRQGFASDAMQSTELLDYVFGTTGRSQALIHTGILQRTATICGLHDGRHALRKTGVPAPLAATLGAGVTAVCEIGRVVTACLKGAAAGTGYVMGAGFDALVWGLHVVARRPMPPDPGKTPLMHAVEGRRMDEAMERLRAGADAAHADANGDTPLMKATALCNTIQGIELFDAMLRTRPDVDAANREGNTAIMRMAARGGDLLRHYPRPRAYMWQHIGNLRAMCRASKHIDHTNVRGDTALMVAASHHSSDLAEALLKAGADVNVAAPHGNALKNAVRSCRDVWSRRDDAEAHLVRMLLRAGADVEGRGGSDTTPLIDAVEADSPGAIRALLEAGANPNGSSGQPPLLHAARLGRHGSIAPLLAAGADVNARHGCGQTALMAAAEKDDAYLIAVLIKAGAEIDAQDDDGNTALMLAFQPHAQANVTRLSTDRGAQIALLKRGANVSCTNHAGESIVSWLKPLERPTSHLVSLRHDYRMAQILTRAGAEYPWID